MQITLRQLEVFATAARTLNFSKAAKELHMTPPAITKQISNLEKFCKTELFEHVGRRVYLSNAGTMLLKQVMKIFNEIEDLKTIVRHSFSEDKRIITLSIGQTFQNIMFNIVHGFNKVHPEIEFNIHVEPRQTQFEHIENNSREICIMTSPYRNPSARSIKFMDVDFTLVASIENPIAKKRNFDEKMLVDQTFLMIKPFAKQDTVITDFLYSQGLSENKVIYLSSYAAIKAAAVANLGVGFVPASLIKDPTSQKELKILKLPKFDFSLPVYYVHRKHKKTSEAAELFIEFLKTEAEKFTL